MEFSIVLAAVPYSHFATGSGAGQRVLGMEARSCSASPTHAYVELWSKRAKTDAAGVTDGFSTSSDNQRPRRRRRSCDRRLRKRGDEQRPKGERQILPLT